MLDIKQIIKDSAEVKLSMLNDTQRIQEGHLLVEHILCESVEASIRN